MGKNFSQSCEEIHAEKVDNDIKITCMAMRRDKLRVPASLRLESLAELVK